MIACVALILAAVAVAHAADGPKSWAAGNGNCAYSNVLEPAPDRIDGSCFRWKVVK